jgi:hypothetical protein
MIITNAVSLNMLPPDCASGGIIFRRIGVDKARQLVRQADTIVSAIGHADTARLVGQALGIELPADRRNVVLGDELMLVCQYVGPRLPSGAKIEYFLVRLADLKELSWRRGEAMLYPLGGR